MKVKLEFKSPFIIGGVKLVNNYIESIDYIPGNVLRAAFARYILNNCSEYCFDETKEVDGEHKRHWIYYREKEGCKDCRLMNWCKNFSSIKFSYFYPAGAYAIPLTALVCKKKEEHGFIDCLVEQKQCTKCEDRKGRVEFVTGLMKDRKKYNVTKTFFTKTEIDRYTKTSKDGSLYSVVAVSETSDNENIYEGKIEGISSNDLKVIDEVRVGKYLSVGFGKCRVIEEKEDKIDHNSILSRMDEFSNKYISFQRENTTSQEKRSSSKYKYFSIKLTADAKLQFKQNLEDYQTTEEYKELWEKTLDIDERFKIEKIYAETFYYRGYDLSKRDEEKREEPSIMIQKGSVIVFRTVEEFKEVIEHFRNIDGFGLETENGFGEFSFYFGGVYNE